LEGVIELENLSLSSEILRKLISQKAVFAELFKEFRNVFPNKS